MSTRCACTSTPVTSPTTPSSVFLHEPPPLEKGSLFSQRDRASLLSCPRCLLGWDMDRTPLRCQHRLAQPLAECRVRVDRLNQLITREFTTHSNRIFRNQVGRIWTDDMRTENLVVLAQD